MKDFFDLLLFPRKIHERSSDPGPFADYRSYKPHLQREFRRKCVYCREADGLRGYEGFGVDHYEPKSDDPGLTMAWSNLFYACNVCNTWKGKKVSTPERFIPNPCKHRMAEHLQYRDADIETYTLNGEWMAELLHLVERRERRKFILSTLGLCLLAYGELSEILSVLDARLGTAASLDPAFVEDRQRTVAELEEMRSHIERLTGEPITTEP